MSAPLAHDTDLSPEAVELLRRGAAHSFGLCCRPGEIRKSYPFLRQAERLGYVRFLDLERPFITEAGRAAIGAPTEAEADYAKLVLLCAGARKRKPLTPTKRDDPRTDFDYRSYKQMGYGCVLAVKAPDDRVNPQSVKIVVPGSSKPEGLGPKNSIIQPESEGKFVVACIPLWLQRKLKLPTGNLPLPDHETHWTSEDRETWERLRNVCFSINSRIRNANRAKRQNLAFGQWA